MINRISAVIVVMLTFITILVSCNPKSEEEVIQEAEDIAQKTFTSSQTITPNQELDHLSLYLPNHLEIEEIDENNIILSDNKQTYIIFYNNLEDPTSELNYQIASNRDALLLEAFQDEEKFGYIQIISEDEDKYEIQIGVGGAKITTYTNKNRMINHVEELMEIALSIAESNNQDD